MKKKPIMFFLVCLGICAGIFVTAIFYNSKGSETDTETQGTPIKVLYEQYDQNNNLLQQILYNEMTGEFINKEYTYELRKNPDTWVCTDVKTTISQKTALQADNVNARPPAYNIYHNSDLKQHPIILIDNEKVKAQITGYLTNSSWYEIAYEFKIENKTDQVLTISFEDVAIMDIYCQPVFHIDHVEPGQTIYFVLGWNCDTLKRCWIPYIDNIDFMLKVYDTEDWKSPAYTGALVLMRVD